MLAIIVDKKPVSFDEIERKLAQMIKNMVTPYSRDPMLRKVEDPDSLYNIALVKLHEACQNFVYEDSYSDEHNERRFLKLFITYVRNAMIDEKYAANVAKRKPKGAIIPILAETDEDGAVVYDCINDPESLQPEVNDIVHGDDICRCIANMLRPDDRKIFELLRQGNPPETVAGKLGILTSRVRHVLYSRIQPSVESVLRMKLRNA